MKTILDRVFSEGRHKKAKYVGASATRRQKEVPIYHWDISAPVEDNISMYSGEPVVKIHRWWGGGEKSLEFGKQIVPTIAHLLKHLKAAEETGALLIVNTRFASLVGRSVKVAWLIDTGEEKFIADDFVFPEISESEWICLGCSEDVTERIYILSEEKAKILDSVLALMYNKVTKSEKEKVEGESPILNWPFPEKSD
jgi:hypothetical protein